MKRSLLYIIVFFAGITIGYFLFIHNFSSKELVFSKEGNYLASVKPVSDKKEEFLQSAANLLGESIIIEGAVKEAYKNKRNEVVLYVIDANIPVTINCTLRNSDLQILEPIRLGESINLQGTLTRLSEQMYLDKCHLIYRAEARQ